MFSYLLIGYNVYNIYCIPQLFAYYPKFLALIVVFDCQYISWFFCIAGLGSYQQTVEPTSYHFPEGNLYGTKTWSGPVPFLKGLLSLQLFLLMQFLLILFSLLSLLGSWYAKYVGFLVFFFYIGAIYLVMYYEGRCQKLLRGPGSPYRLGYPWFVL